MMRRKYAVCLILFTLLAVATGGCEQKKTICPNRITQRERLKQRNRLRQRIQLILHLQQ